MTFHSFLGPKRPFKNGSDFLKEKRSCHSAENGLLEIVIFGDGTCM